MPDKIYTSKSRELQPGTDHYTDGNGVRWTVAWTGDHVLAFVKDDDPAQVRVYTPPAEDFVTVRLKASTSEIGDVDPGSQQEADTRSFINLRELIDKYSVAHKKNVSLVVRASRDGGAGWLIALGLGLGFYLATRRR